MTMLRTEHAAGVATLTLERPDRGNALSAELVDALLAAVQACCADADTHTLILEAAGAHFCTGFDLSDLDTSSDGDLLLRFVRIETLLATIWHAPLRTIARARGRCWGAGADLFAACEQRVAVVGSSFRFPGAGFGLVLGTRRLAERVGADRARHWILDGVTLDASNALAAGLASEVRESGLAFEPPTAPVIDRATAARIRAASRIDHRDADLTALVNSAAAPGLKQRIQTYRAAVKRTRDPR